MPLFLVKLILREYLQGFAVMPAPTVFLSHTEVNLFSFLPSATALERSTLVIHEIMGRAWYKLRY